MVGHSKHTIDHFPVVPDIKKFDQNSGSWLEQLIFNHRLVIVVTCAIITLILGYSAVTKLSLNASFEKMMPLGSPYIQNYLQNQKALGTLGNAIRVVVENPDGTIFDPAYLKQLQEINDALFLTPGVDRAWMKSLWTPLVRWMHATPRGFDGGPVMPGKYDGSQESIHQLRANIIRSQVAQRLVAEGMQSSMIYVPLFDFNPNTGKPLDYWSFSNKIEDIRAKYEDNGVNIYVTGFAVLVGDLIDGLIQIIGYFALAVLIAAVAIYFETRDSRCSLIVIGCSLVAVLWQLGVVAALGYVLNPYSILVPFLVFAIGVSHGSQKMNGILQDIGRGTHKLVAARYTFRRLFVAGLTALVADAVGFAVLMLIDIPVIQELALTASVGLALLIFTNLVLLPVLLSYAGVSRKAATRSVRAEDEDSDGRGHGTNRLLRPLVHFTSRPWAVGAIAAAAALTAGGYIVSLDLKVGDLGAGAPELWPDSRYNQDVAFINEHYSLSSDVFAVIVKTAPGGCLKYETLIEVQRLAWQLRQLPGVQTTVSLPGAMRLITSAMFGGMPKWFVVPRNEFNINYTGLRASDMNSSIFNQDCSITPLIAYLENHKADTLERVVKTVSEFAAAHNTPDRKFLMAAGSAGIQAATNIAVHKAHWKMLLYVYAAVIVLCFITFRSWRAVLVAVIPLAITSILCEALMVLLGIGVTVSTLPVIALGVGIGVDYALYLLSVQLDHQRAGETLSEAYRHALNFTGKIVLLVGVTLAAGVVTWVFSPIKFQADMGLLLTFMFLWNMVGALILIPALSHFLLGDGGKMRGAAQLAPS